MMERETDPSTVADDQVIPAAASDSWRSWLMTGVRRGPVARRRVRGAHKGLKTSGAPALITAQLRA